MHAGASRDLAKIATFAIAVTASELLKAESFLLLAFGIGNWQWIDK